MFAFGSFFAFLFISRDLSIPRLGRTPDHNRAAFLRPSWKRGFGGIYMFSRWNVHEPWAPCHGFNPISRHESHIVILVPYLMVIGDLSR
jgi:hypothetical protein